MYEEEMCECECCGTEVRSALSRVEYDEETSSTGTFCVECAEFNE